MNQSTIPYLFSAYLRCSWFLFPLFFLLLWLFFEIMYFYYFFFPCISLLIIYCFYCYLSCCVNTHPELIKTYKLALLAPEIISFNRSICLIFSLVKICSWHCFSFSLKLHLFWHTHVYIYTYRCINISRILTINIHSI